VPPAQEQQTKREFLGEWVSAVKQHGGFGFWEFDVSRNPNDIVGILEGHS
jgi:type III restriction enzyme